MQKRCNGTRYSGLSYTTRALHYAYIKYALGVGMGR